MTRIAAVVGGLAVCCGAFGAHGLSRILTENQTLTIWQTAAQYHLVHSAVLLWVAKHTVPHRAPFLLFLIGILVFSGSLYVLAVTNLKWLGAITPIGGSCLIIGWLSLWKTSDS